MLNEAIEIICDRLSERNATLFLGAGINFGIENNAGELFPLGQELSSWICRDLLNEPNFKTTLDEAAEIARFSLGEKELNRYLYDKFSSFKPGTAHLALVQLPWDVIYTTNYDLLVEEAARLESVDAAGVIQSVFSMNTDLTTFSEEDILYYKLHGSIDFANSEEGRLILTKEDYRYYEIHRKSLFRRLKRDLESHTFVFVGYSLTDGNFRAILEDSRNEIGTRTLPLSFAIRPGFSKLEANFWRDKYNIQLIDADGSEFLNNLKETWIAQNRSVIPFDSRKSKEYLQVDKATRFRKIAESFYLIRPADCTGPSDAKLFFRGAEPSWGDIREKIPPRRDAYWTILETLFPELSTPELPASLYLITGAAGTGKTTLIRSIAYDIANDFYLPVLVHIPNTPLDARFLTHLVDDKNLKRIIVMVRDAAEHIRAVERFIEEAKHKSLPITVILEERQNQWNVASSSMRSKLTPVKFELGELSQNEISNILDALATHEALGKLTGSPHDYQVDHFTELAHKELLVALRELTTQASFDDIIRDEFNKIPSATAKQAYLYVAVLGQLDLAIRYETLINLLELRYDQLAREVFQPTEGVLISGEETGSSRHNNGFRLRTRHPVIASIIFDMAAPDDDSKFDILNSLLEQLDPGYNEDRRLLNVIIRRRELVNIFASPEKRRAIYERLSTILPNNYYVYQHRSILERDLDNSELAIYYARKALSLNSNNPALLNTLGLALELAARTTDEPLRRQALLSEASNLFDDGIRRNPSDPFGYLGKVFILKQAIKREPDNQRKKLLKAEALSLLEEAYETTESSSIIAVELANIQKQFGTQEDAFAVLSFGLEKDPTNTRLRDLWIRLEIKSKHPEKALKVAMDGEKYDPTSWRIQRHIARLQQTLNKPIEAIKGHYEAAIRHNKGDIDLMVEFGSYLFMNDRHSEAENIFSESRKLPISGDDKQKVRQWWKDTDGYRVKFSGKVSSIRGAIAWAITIPGNFEASFWRNRPGLSDLREGNSISFFVGFNAYGPSAQQIKF